jgi:cold shock CspA family protein
MRFKGSVVEWRDNRGFGFINPVSRSARVFCHISAFALKVRRPVVGTDLINPEQNSTFTRHNALFIDE